MIIVQTPLRVSLFGGGTDFRSFFLEEGGCVLSSAIDKYIFVTIKKRFDHMLRVGYTQTEMVDRVADIQHDLIREAFVMTGIDRGVEITTMGDIPSRGSGLGSSSTVTVGTLHAMYTLKGEMVTAECLARQACQIEIDRLGKPIGIQDQYIAAFGGLRFMEFKTNGEVLTQKIELSPSQARRLNENLLLFFTGITRRSGTILDEQKQNINHRRDVLCEMKKMAYVARDELLSGNMDVIGELLHESWALKKQLASKISNDGIDEIYASARRAGAIGGKITGAGGGGFLLLYCPHEKQDAVRSALSNLQELPFQLEHSGSKVIFNYQR
jgi:D-glycero-alpha-D-manno-heptose-7-phosphate kinase